VRLSVIVITRNEALNLRACLESVAWADEIVVVDAQSEDATVRIAREFTDKVYEVEWQGYSEAKNYALDRATGDWVLWLDADERVPEELAGEIRAAISSPSGVKGYRIPRKAYFLGRWIRHGGWYPGSVLRLFARGAGRFNGALVHESLALRGRTGELKHPLLHFTDPTLTHYWEKLNRYTSLGAQELLRQGRSFRLRDLVLRPAFFFLRMYVLRFGFLDGIYGLMIAMLSACHVFFKYAKLWEMSRGAARDKAFQSDAGSEKTPCAQATVSTYESPRAA